MMTAVQDVIAGLVARLRPVLPPDTSLTSNKNDFCDDDGRTFHPQLVAGFGAVGLNLCLDWSAARTTLEL
jgi:hypothetical protein